MVRRGPGRQRFVRVTMLVLAMLAVIALVLSMISCAPGGEAGAAATKGSAASGSEGERPVALVYRGPATGCEECSEAVAQLLEKSPRNFEVRFVGPEEETKLSAEALARAELYAQPGGNVSVEEAMEAFGEEAAQVVTDYVEAGGHYAGFCLGAYMAGSDPGMGLLEPGDTDQWITTEGAEVTTEADAVVTVTWGEEERQHFAQDPPYIIESGVEGEKVLSRFSNGEVNALVRPVGKGRIALIGTHPEADRSWYSDSLWKQDADGVEAEDGLALVEELVV